MKKFMVFIYPLGESIFNLTEEAQQQHIQKVGIYLGKLKEAGVLLDAQPLQPVGTILSGKGTSLSLGSIDQVDIVGFYMLKSKNEESLIDVLKQDPRFGDASWKLEIREVLEMM